MVRPVAAVIRMVYYLGIILVMFSTLFTNLRQHLRVLLSPKNGLVCPIVLSAYEHALMMIKNVRRLRNCKQSHGRYL